jgi:alpha-glucosidase
MRRGVFVASLMTLGLSAASAATRSAVAQPAAPDANQLVVSSPSGQVAVGFLLDEGRPYYQVAFGRTQVLRRSRLGFRLKDAAPLEDGFRVADARRRTVDETWEQPWGEARRIRNHFNELTVELVETSAAARRLNVVFRAFDDGVGFRFEWPRQEALGAFEITDELTEFALAPDDEAWWIPAYYVHRYEYLHRKGRIAGLGAVHTPLTVETRQGLYVSLHEAALTDYASMTLQSRGDGVLRCDLVPWSDGVKVKAATPFVSPWRTIQIAEKPGDLITSYLVLNLNEPSRIKDTSWIKPGKYVGIWWGMHLGIWTWGSGPNHGATTERTKSYIDFAAKHGFGGVLVEGWNVGWDGDWIANGDVFSFTKPYPDFDLEALARYAAERGVTLIGHHETAFGIDNYERQLEDAFSLYERLGVRIVKTGYVDNLAPRHELHHGQYMVRHYRKVVEAAARHHIVLDVHEPIKDTGIRRTWPNMMTREGARGMEYNAWSADGGNPPEHETILPFTRLLAGPFDYTPGIFDLKLESAHRPAPASGVVRPRVNTTLAKSLANYVVIYSPQHMAADLIENYEGQPAFKFIEEVPTDWEETRVLNGRIGDYVTIARRDRNSDDWYVGSVSDELARTLDVPLSFLDPDRQYVAEIYADAFNADWEVKPQNIAIGERAVSSRSVLTIRLAPGGGQAIRIRPVE